MQYHWLNRQNNDKIIVFFGGWSFDYKPFEYLDCKDYDVLMFYDYSNLDENLAQTVSNYREKILVAWSMGVFAAYLKKWDFDKKIAVNGTPYPVDDEFGIPKRIFELTLKYAQTGLEGKFYQNVFTNPDWFERYLKTPVERSIDNRVEELVSLDKLIKNTKIEYDGKYFDKAIVGVHDKIIPPKNQLKMWENIAEAVDCGHFPFYNYCSWEELCN